MWWYCIPMFWSYNLQPSINSMLIRLIPASIGGFDCSSCGVVTI